jgi:hypothetical protein
LYLICGIIVVLFEENNNMGMCKQKDYSSLLGSFVEKEVRGFHEYSANTDDMSGESVFTRSFPHVLHTLDGVRYARILKTVAYIAVDEDAYGMPVVEKWYITSHKKYS